MKAMHFVKARQALLLACVGIAGFAGARWVRSYQVHAQAPAKPFTVTLEMNRHVNGNPKAELYARETTARKSDGTTVVLRTVGPINAGLTFRKITTIDGRETLVHDALNAKTTSQGAQDQVASRRNMILNPSPNCVSSQFVFLRNDMVLRHKVAVLSFEKDNIRVMRWVAEDLGCAVLGGTYEERNAAGAWELHQTEKAINLTLGEPQSSLFDIPDGLVELRPSEASSRYHARLGAREDIESQRTSRMLDRKYESEHPKQ